MAVEVWVVMGNDFPEAVFSSEEKADEFVAKAKAREDKPRRVHWRAYKFTVDKDPLA